MVLKPRLNVRKVAKIKEEKWGRKRKRERKRGERVGRAEAESWRKDWKDGMPKEKLGLRVISCVCSERVQLNLQRCRNEEK